MWGNQVMSWSLAGQGWGGVWPIVLASVALVVAGVASLCRREPVGTRHRRVAEDRAAAILRERYAHGEIDQPEFEEQMKRLTSRG